VQTEKKKEESVVIQMQAHELPSSSVESSAAKPMGEAGSNSHASTTVSSSKNEKWYQVWFGDISFQVTQKQLESLVQKYGEVISVKVNMSHEDGSSINAGESMNQ